MVTLIYIYIYSNFPRQGLDLYFTGGMCMTWSSFSPVAAGRENRRSDLAGELKGKEGQHT